MPKGYLKMRNAIAKRFRSQGMSAKGAMKRAKSIAAPVWNKSHKTKVTRKPHK